MTKHPIERGPRSDAGETAPKSTQPTRKGEGHAPEADEAKEGVGGAEDEPVSAGRVAVDQLVRLLLGAGGLMLGAGGLLLGDGERGVTREVRARQDELIRMGISVVCALPSVMTIAMASLVGCSALQTFRMAFATLASTGLAFCLSSLQQVARRLEVMQRVCLAASMSQSSNAQQQARELDRHIDQEKYRLARFVLYTGVTAAFWLVAALCYLRLTFILAAVALTWVDSILAFSSIVCGILAWRKLREAARIPEAFSQDSLHKLF